MKIIGKIIDAVMWLFKPRIIVVDREMAKYLMQYGGAKLVGVKRNK